MFMPFHDRIILYGSNAAAVLEEAKKTSPIVLLTNDIEILAKLFASLFLSLIPKFLCQNG